MESSGLFSHRWRVDSDEVGSEVRWYIYRPSAIVEPLSTAALESFRAFNISHLALMLELQRASKETSVIIWFSFSRLLNGFWKGILVHWKKIPQRSKYYRRYMTSRRFLALKFCASKARLTSYTATQFWISGLSVYWGKIYLREADLQIIFVMGLETVYAAK